MKTIKREKGITSFLPFSRGKGAPREGKSRKAGAGKRIAALLFTFFFAFCFSFSGKITMAEEGSNSLRLDGVADGMSVSLYEVAAKQEDGSFALTQDFASAGVKVDGLSSDELASLGTTMDAYIAEKQPNPVSTQTAAGGSCQWTGLEDGLYIAVAPVFNQDGKLMEYSPIVAYLPYTEDGNWVRDMRAQVKAPSEVPQDTVMSVYKVWEDGDGSGRPQSISASLVQQDSTGSRVYDTQVLDQDNNWSYTWTKLPQGYSYRVVESQVPEGYTQSIAVEGNKTVITNTKSSGQDKNSGKGSGSSSGKLPQTGQLWWPLPYLAAGGLLCLLIGFWQKYSTEKKA